MTTGEQLFEMLEPRIVLSLTYYETVAIEEFIGFPGGDSGSLAGASEDGRFLWSHGSTADARDIEDPAFLVVDRVYHPLMEFPALDGAFIADINSNGDVLAQDVFTGRIFLADLLGHGERQYLEDRIDSVPDGFDLRAVTPMELGDDGIIIFTDNESAQGASQVWGMIGGAVQELWRSETSTQVVWTGPENMVVATRYTAYDPMDWTKTHSEGVLWTPQNGLESLAILEFVFGLNSRGEVVGQSVPNQHGDVQRVIWGDGVVTPVEDRYTSGVAGVDDDGHVLLWRHESGSSGWAWDIPSVSRNGVIAELGQLGGYGGKPVDITDSGLLVLSGSISERVLPETLAGASDENALLTTDASGRVIVVFKNRRGTIGSLDVLDNEIHYGEWALQGNSSSFPANTAAYTSLRDGSARFLLLNSPTVFDTQQHRLERETALLPLTSLSTTVFQSRAGLERIALQDEFGDLRLWFQKPGTDWRGNPKIVWNPVNLSLKHLAMRGLPTPAFASNLDSFTTPWGAMNIVGLDDAGDLHAVWWSPGLGSPVWTTSNLSDITGAPKLVGNIVGSATAWNGMQVMGTDERGHLVSIWWSPTSGGWKWADLTAEAGGIALEAGSLAGATTPWGAIEVVGRTAENDLVTYWWAPGSDGWVFESITAQQVGDVPRITGPVSLVVASDGSQHIAGVSDSGEVIHLFWLRDGADLWRAENLTALAIG